MKIKHYIYITLTALLAVGCTEEDGFVSPVQHELIGKAVNFNASIADPFTTRATNQHNGSFNEGDIMTIYRQYEENGSFDATTEAYRVYYLETKYATGTSISLGTDWKPLVYNATNYPYAIGSNSPGTTFQQTAGDSLTWENGKTVRFRAWSRSNLAGTLTNGGAGYYYPDYCVSGWVTVSGPTQDIPLSLKHQGCRIGFYEKSGNRLYKAEICTETEDYMWEDNSTTAAADEADKWAEAAEKAAAVKAVYEKMCMPAGVDINTSLLNTMTTTLYTTTSNGTKRETNFASIHTKTESEGIVKFNKKTADEIKSSVQRPLFTSNFDNRLYMITIPYDMSTASTQGEVLVLPPYTRFRIYLYDVNNGDKAQTSGYEATYHIFSLSDIKKSSTSTEALFPDGLELTAGNSYLFQVGYQYDYLTITAEDNFSWVAQDLAETQASNAVVTPATQTTPYGWWKNAISIEIDSIETDNSQSYNPVFHISTAEEFKEFINLVNGTATTTTSGITLYYNSDDDKYYWYRSTDIDEKGKPKKDTSPVDKTTLEGEGYIFYEHYYPANADQPAYSLEDYIRGPYSFYDQTSKQPFTIYLEDNLDMNDWELETIGNTTEHPFRGFFDGQMKTIKNIYMKNEYLFGHCIEVGIRNLKIETTHPFKLLNSAEATDEDTGFGGDIVGVSIKAPSTGNPFATSLTGSSYVVGCYYEGKAGGAMIGTANNLYMHGNMMVASGLTKETGALLGAYADSNKKFLAPQTAKTKSWGRFMVNYYDITKSPTATAVGGIDDAYSPQEYIRGSESHILKAKNDNLLADDVPYTKLTDQMKKGYYGLAPWKAMNYAIYLHNKSSVGNAQPCKGRYVNNTIGYGHTYPELVEGAPDSSADDTGYKGNYDSLNVLEQNN